MTGHETAVEDIIEGMLTAGKRFGGIIVLVVDMQIVVLHSITGFLGQQIVVDKRFRRLRSELHHHAGRSVGVHVGILARHIVVLDVHDIKEHLTCLRLTGNRTLIAIGDILLCHILTARLHQFKFY